MNDTIKTILARRSIKSDYKTSVKAFSDQQISAEHRDLLLEAASYAPNARGLQPWHFTVIQKRDLIDEIAEGTKKAVLQREMPPDIMEKIKSPGYHSLYNAPTCIVLSGNSDESRYAMVDCAMAGQNILLAAESLGLGTCFTALNAEFFRTAGGKVFAEKVGIPQGYTTFFVIAVGYKAAAPPQPTPRRENIFSLVE